MSRLLLVLLVLTSPLFSSALAQRVKFQSTGLLEFAPTQNDFVDALLCPGCTSLDPSGLSADFQLRVLRQGKRAYTLNVQHEGWVPQGAPELEARYTIQEKRSGKLSVTDWLTLDSARQDLFYGREPVTDIKVEYRLRLNLQEKAGTYETSVRYGVGNSSVRHRVRVVIPSVTLLRIKDRAGSAIAAQLNFDYSGVDALSYMQAVTSGEPLQVTSSSLEQVEIFTNNPKGYLVSVTVDPIDGPVNGDLSKSDIYLFGRSAEGQRLNGNSATNGFETLILPQDFSLHITGNEASGSYTFSVRYRTVLKP